MRAKKHQLWLLLMVMMGALLMAGEVLLRASVLTSFATTPPLAATTLVNATTTLVNATTTLVNATTTLVNATSEFNTTIVTCFFDLGKHGLTTKHAASFYLKAGSSGVLGIKSPMVIFTDSPREVAKARKYPELTHIVNVSLSEFVAYQKHYTRLKVLFTRDLEDVKFRYSALLLVVYHTKPEVVTRAIALDYFHTDKYVYMDVGSIRNWAGIVAADYVGKPFPSSDRERFIGHQDRVQLQSGGDRISFCERNVRWVEAESPDNVTDVSHRKHPDTLIESGLKSWIAGAIFSGNKRGLSKYALAYYIELQRYMDAGVEYAVIDQYLMGVMACKYDFVEVIRLPEKCCAKRLNRAWFFMLMFYTNATYPQTAYTHKEMLKRGMIKP